uniref:Uncharacterized protein n=1 Tax=Sus scrofa TaxID=9823 RepID=A0A8D0NZH4_PIG
ISPDKQRDKLPEKLPRLDKYQNKYQHEKGSVTLPIVFLISNTLRIKPEIQLIYNGSEKEMLSHMELLKVVFVFYITAQVIDSICK